LVNHLPGVLKVFGDSQAMTFQPYLVRLVLAMGIVLPATAGMGATIPIMNALVHSYLKDVGKSTALAYGVNALGAVVGCLAGGFLLIEHLGVQNSLYIAALLNALVVVSASMLGGEPRIKHTSKGFQKMMIRDLLLMFNLLSLESLSGCPSYILAPVSWR
jgi:predicted membrane-bound spermidine synthase